MRSTRAVTSDIETQANWSTPRQTLHLLYQGRLSDMPGRNERWDDYVRYLGRGQWEWVTRGTDFFGAESSEVIKEKMGTRKLISWVLDRDEELLSEDDYQVQHHHPEDEDEEPEARPREFGPHADNLRYVAEKVGAIYCVECLERWLVNDWPPRRRPKPVKILEVLGRTRRGIWIRIYHDVFDVMTTLGPAYLYPPDKGGYAKLIFKSESSLSEGRRIRIPKNVVEQINSLDV